jgi:hypothetical protein
LVDVKGSVVGENRDVDSLTAIRGKPAAHWTGLLNNVETRGAGAGEPQQAHAEPVLAPVLGLLHDVVALQGVQQPERR